MSKFNEHVRLEDRYRITRPILSLFSLEWNNHNTLDNMDRHGAHKYYGQGWRPYLNMDIALLADMATKLVVTF